MFPSTTTESPARRSLSQFLRDALETTIEFATLGEATLDGEARGKVRYVGADEVAAAPVPLPASIFGEDATRVPRATGRFARPAVVTAHPHRLALAPPSRPRRPGAVLPRVPVCTMPVAPVAPQRSASGSAPSTPPAPSQQHSPRT